MSEAETGSIAWLRARGFRPRRSWGQNFLFDGNLLRLIIREADFDGTEQAVEVGAGIGNLTAELAAAARWVTAIEIDPRLVALAAERLEGRANIRLLEGDALAGKHAFAADLERAVATGGRPLKVVANLPYAVAAPVIALAMVQWRPSRFVVTVQKEVADRLIAGPGEPSYGALSVLVRAFGTPRRVRGIRPEAFWPRPKVHSSLVCIEAGEERFGPEEWTSLQRVVHVAFRHPRKQVRQGMISTFGEIAAEGLGDLDPAVRPSEVPVEVYVRISKSLRG